MRERFTELFLFLSVQMGHAGIKRGKSINIGLEIGLLDHAIKLDVDVYQKKSSDLLIQRPADDRTAGRVLPYENVGEMLNKGIDITLNTRNYQTEVLYWNSTLSLNVPIH